MALIKTDSQILQEFDSEGGIIGELHSGFVATHAQRLRAMRPRFAQRHDPQEKVSSARIIDIFGIDVSHIYHPVKQLHIVRNLVSVEPVLGKITVTKKQYDALSVTAIVHDMAEVLTGDIAYGDKTAEQEHEEIYTLDTVLTNTFGNTPQIGKLYGTATEILSGDDEALSDIFLLSERVGYFETGIVAGYMSLSGAVELETDEHAMAVSMAKDVTRRHADFLTGFTDLSYVSQLLGEYTDTTSNVQALLAAA